jgi:5'-phosphate synthase pdxT subunit
VVQVRLAKHLDEISGLIIPGGESTTIGKLATEFGLMDPLRMFGEKQPFGHCAGAIFLSKTPVVNSPCWGSWILSLSATLSAARWTALKWI